MSSRGSISIATTTTTTTRQVKFHTYQLMRIEAISERPLAQGKHNQQQLLLSNYNFGRCMNYQY